jgi:hypothetical protein
VLLLGICGPLGVHYLSHSLNHRWPLALCLIQRAMRFRCHCAFISHFSPYCKSICILWNKHLLETLSFPSCCTTPRSNKNSWKGFSKSYIYYNDLHSLDYCFRSACSFVFTYHFTAVYLGVSDVGVDDSSVKIDIWDELQCKSMDDLSIWSSPLDDVLKLHLERGDRYEWKYFSRRLAMLGSVLVNDYVRRRKP